MKKKYENYLERKPCRPETLSWSMNKENLVILEVENKGFFHRVAQRCFKKPKVSFIHLDEMGSFLWPLMDGTKTILDLGKEVDQKFGEQAHPLYERLAKYLQILDSYGFIEWK